MAAHEYRYEYEHNGVPTRAAGWVLHEAGILNRAVRRARREGAEGVGQGMMMGRGAEGKGFTAPRRETGGETDADCTGARLRFELHHPHTVEVQQDSATGGADPLLRPAPDLPAVPQRDRETERDGESTRRFVEAIGVISSRPAVMYTAASLSVPAERLALMERRTLDVLVPTMTTVDREGQGGTEGDTEGPDKRGRAALSGYYHILETVDCVFGEGSHGDSAWRRCERVAPFQLPLISSYRRLMSPRGEQGAD